MGVARSCCAGGNDPTCSGNYSLRYGEDCPRACVDDCSWSSCKYQCSHCGLNEYRSTYMRVWRCQAYHEDKLGQDCKKTCECLGGRADKCPPSVPDPYVDVYHERTSARLSLFGAMALMNGFLSLCLSVFAACAASAASAVISEHGGPTGPGTA